MDINLANHVSECKRATSQAKNDLCIVRGPHRLNNADWSAVHAIVLQGWFAIRRGNEVLIHFADTEEGNA